MPCRGRHLQPSHHPHQGRFATLFFKFLDGVVWCSDDVPPPRARLISFFLSAETMVFMKGTPDAPRCGFSRTLVGLLREESIGFESFDILEDEDVRQGLKDLSNWPTYPQVRHVEYFGVLYSTVFFFVLFFSSFVVKFSVGTKVLVVVLSTAPSGKKKHGESGAGGEK